jgi:hypothetical protein
MRLFITFLIIPILLICCKGKSKKSFQTEIKKGEIVSVHCINAPMEDYALYLPTAYDPATKYPVVVFLDSHGKGNYPVELYKTLSEKYGVVLSGSNKIKNGMEMNDVFSVYLDLLYDLRKRFSVDTSMIFLSGFSGGARMASIIAMSQPNISGVISCSAGMDPGMLKYNPAFPYVCITGIADMNYSELVSLNEQMNKTKLKHQLLVFNGKHEWPPLETMNEALLFLFLSNNNKIEKAQRSSIVDSAKEYFSKKLAFRDKKSGLKWLRTEEQYVNYLEGLTDVSASRKIIDSLQKSPGVKLELHQEEYIQKREENYKKSIQDAFINKNFDWWKTEVASLNQKTSTSPESEAGMYKRVLTYASLVSFSYVNHALSSNKTDLANAYLQIYSLVDPENPDCTYFKACYYSLLQDHYNTIKYLNEAIDKGFSDAEKIKTDPAFAHLQYDSEFSKTVNRIKNK